MVLVESFSGIRGIYDDGLDEQVALRYSYVYSNFLKNKYKALIKSGKIAPIIPAMIVSDRGIRPEKYKAPSITDIINRSLRPNLSSIIFKAVSSFLYLPPPIS